MDVYRSLKTPTFTSFAQDDFSDYLKAMFHNFVYTCRRIKQKHFKQKRFWKTGYMYFHRNIQKAVHMYTGRYTEEESALLETRITSPESRGMSVNQEMRQTHMGASLLFILNFCWKVWSLKCVQGVNILYLLPSVVVKDKNKCQKNVDCEMLNILNEPILFRYGLDLVSRKRFI